MSLIGAGAALRPYQVKSLEAVHERYAAGVRRQLISMPTGAGKTVVFANLPEATRNLFSGQMMVIAHREELLDQAAQKIKTWNPGLSVSIEQADRYADPNADVIVASVATLGRTVSKRRDRFDWDRITTCVVDEAHHATAATYKNLLTAGGFLDPGSNKLLIGVTATPNRADGTPLAEVFDEIVFDYSLREAIDDGWLSDLACIRVNTQTWLDDVHTTAGDFNQGELADEVNTPERNRLIVDAWLRHGVGRQTIVFAVDIKHAIDLAGMFRARGVKAEAVWGDDPDRAQKLAAHRRGDIAVLTNVGVLTEGYDDPSIACVVTARPTKSSLLFQQMIGRGTRLELGVENRLTHPLPLKKRDCLILDVIDNTRRHSLATVPSLFGMPEIDLRGGSVTESLKKLEAVQRRYPTIDLSGLTDIANLDQYVLSLPNKEHATIRQNILGKYTASVTIHDKTAQKDFADLGSAFAAVDNTVRRELGSAAMLVCRNSGWHKGAATPSQVNTLRKLYKGRVFPADLTKGTASRLIQHFFANQEGNHVRHNSR